MISSPPRQSRSITAVRRNSNHLALNTEYGDITIAIPASGIFHIRHTPQVELHEIERLGVRCKSEIEDWSHKESDAEIIVLAGDYSLVIQKHTASIACYGHSGKCLYRERDEESRVFREFDVFQPVEQEGAELEYIETPDGRKPVVPKAPEVFARKLCKTQLHLSVTEDEMLFGLGQGDRGDFNLQGTTQYLHQSNMKIAVPILMSTRSYGLLLNTYAPILFTERKGTASFYCEGDTAIDYYILLGENFDDLIAGYRTLTGKASMLPKWAFGYIQSQERYETSWEMTDTVAEYRRRGIGLDCIVLDWNSWEGNQWGQKTLDPARFPDPSALTKTLHDMNVKMMVSIWPSFGETAPDYRELKAKEKMLPLSNIYNAFDKEARAIYWRQTDQGLFRHGVDAWWCDSSEPVTAEWSHEEEPSQHAVYEEYLAQSAKSMPYELSNAYSLYHSSGIYEGQRSTSGEKRVVNLTRSAYLGQQRYGTISWSGDIAAKWEVLRQQIVAGLQFCVTGSPYWTLDIGAFFVKKGKNWFWNGDYQGGNQDLGYRELYTRWYQLGVFLPVFRSHGTDTRRELWHFGDEGSMFYDAMVKANRLRYRLMPTIYSYAGCVWLEDFTLLRMLAFDFQEDRRAMAVEDQFMFGRDILVCPVINPMYYGPDSTELSGIPRERTVYLPAGTGWVAMDTPERYEGGREYTIPVAIDTIPLFVREGSILVTGNAESYVDDAGEAPLTLHVYSGKDADFLYYDDAHDGYGYEKGEYFTVSIHWDEQTRRLTLSDVQGGYWQETARLSFRILVDGTEVNTVEYTGKAVTMV